LVEIDTAYTNVPKEGLHFGTWSFSSPPSRTRKYKINKMFALDVTAAEPKRVSADGHGGPSFVRLHFPVVCSEPCRSNGRPSWTSGSWVLSSTRSSSSRKAEAIQSAPEDSEVSLVSRLPSVVFNGANEDMDLSLLLRKYPVAVECRRWDARRLRRLQRLSSLSQVFNLRVLLRPP
jgi:hypothetical protein